MILQQLKLTAAVVALALGCGFAGFAIEQRLHEPRAVVEVHQIAPEAHAPVEAPRRKQGSVRDHVASDRRAPAKRHHHTPHRSAEDDIADVLNRGQL